MTETCRAVVIRQSLQNRGGARSLLQPCRRWLNFETGVRMGGIGDMDERLSGRSLL